MLPDLAFYLFASLLLISALLVISARNPVHSVLFLIMGFFNAAGLFVLLGAEFIAFVVAIVYVGAVAVLFLFVVMMMDINRAELQKQAMRYLPLGLLIGGILLAELTFLYMVWEAAPKASLVMAAPTPDPAQVTNTHALGAVLYTQNVLPFQVVGLILLVAMIGAIVLTHRVRPGVKRQIPSEQVAVRPKDVVEVQKITPGSGI